jgi:hypothetical protein
VLFLVSACSNHSDVNEKNVVALFKTKWEENFSGYKLRSRGPGKGLIVKSDIACQKDTFHRYYYDSASSAYGIRSDEIFISNNCVIDAHDPEIPRLIGLFDELSIYELIAIKNDYGIVQLCLSENESIYYVNNLDLPKSAKEWLNRFSAEQIDLNFFYVKSSESIWGSL